MCKNYSSSNRSLVTTLVVLAICLVIVTGSTFSLFTSNTGVNIAVTAGNVELTANIIKDTFKIFSMDRDLSDTEVFENGGTAKFNTTYTTLTLDKITPGDKVAFQIQLENKSNVDVKYRVTWTLVGDDAFNEALVTTVNATEIKDNTSEWTLWTPAEEKIQTLDIVVEFPTGLYNEAERYEKYRALMNKTLDIEYKIEAVQANGIGLYDGIAYVSTEQGLKEALESGCSSIKLNNDITLTEAWTPIGTSEEPFTGTFDGNGHTIYGLTVADTEYAAFIAYAGENTVIKNLTFDNVSINSTKHAAGVVCIAGNGITIENVTVSGQIIAASYAGGILHNAANATIKNCVNEADVSANRAGGIASWVTVGANLENVTNYGDITGGVGASGIAHGFAGTVKNAANYGEIISNNYEAASGIVGVQKAASTYEYCVNYGNVTSTYDDPNASAAGILGQSAGSASTLKYCANYGHITAENSYAAGIAYSLYGTINASYCYNAATINGADGAGAIAPKAQYGTTDKASYCLNAGRLVSANGLVYNGSNNNISSFYGEETLYNVTGDVAVALEDALAVLNSGADADFFAIENGVIIVKDWHVEVIHPVFATVVTTPEQLADALANAQPGEVIDATGVTFDVTNNNAKLPAGVTIKGATIANVGSQHVLSIAAADSELILEDCSISTPDMAMFVIGVEAGGKGVVFNNCTFTGQITPNCTASPDAVITFNNCSFTLANGAGSVGYVNCMGGRTEFYGCTFDYTGGATFGSNQYTQWSAVNAYSESRFSAYVLLEGCTFIGCTTYRVGPNSTLIVR